MTLEKTVKEKVQSARAECFRQRGGDPFRYQHRSYPVGVLKVFSTPWRDTPPPPGLTSSYLCTHAPNSTNTSSENEAAANRSFCRNQPQNPSCTDHVETPPLVLVSIRGACQASYSFDYHLNRQSSAAITVRSRYGHRNTQRSHVRLTFETCRHDDYA